MALLYDETPSAELADIFPAFTPAELEQAAADIDNYLGVVLRIMIRVANDPLEYARFLRLTGREPSAGTNRTQSLLTKH